ncbi:hypothetical protein RHGRI_033313 [Rhododendron griersonianum]|uniref:C2H2-type domain-containing protein n=1 Tax=Rhododendron griersonianum TaxID=479676 RepID=A0AAV6I1S9_9ERIC|nr:hypothetical protein RHGRI_033313 [Rhododendron griersonianum]
MSKLMAEDGMSIRNKSSNEKENSEEESEHKGAANVKVEENDGIGLCGVISSTRSSPGVLLRVLKIIRVDSSFSPLRSTVVLNKMSDLKANLNLQIFSKVALKWILRGPHDGSPNVQHDEFSGGATVESQLGGSEGFNSHITGLAITAPFRESELLEVKGNFQKVDCVGDVNLFQVRLSSSIGLSFGEEFRCTASIPFDDPPYLRDFATSMRSSLGHGSVSASSSVDVGSARPRETRMQRQLSSRKSDTGTNPKHLRTGSSPSGTSSHAFRGLGPATGMHERENGGAHVQHEIVNITDAAPQIQLLVSQSTGDDICSEVECNYRCETMIASTFEFSTHALNTHSGDSSDSSFSNVESSGLCGN